MIRLSVISALSILLSGCATTAPSWEAGISGSQVGNQQYDLRLRGQF